MDWEESSARYVFSIFRWPFLNLAVSGVPLAFLEARSYVPDEDVSKSLENRDILVQHNRYIPVQGQP